MQETKVQFLGGEDLPEKGNGSPLQYYCMENPMDKEAGMLLCISFKVGHNSNQQHHPLPKTLELWVSPPNFEGKNDSDDGGGQF